MGFQTGKKTMHLVDQAIDKARSVFRKPDGSDSSERAKLSTTIDGKEVEVPDPTRACYRAPLTGTTFDPGRVRRRGAARQDNGLPDG